MFRADGVKSERVGVKAAKNYRSGSRTRNFRATVIVSFDSELEREING